MQAYHDMAVDAIMTLVPRSIAVVQHAIAMNSVHVIEYKIQPSGVNKRTITVDSFLRSAKNLGFPCHGTKSATGSNHIVGYVSVGPRVELMFKNSNSGLMAEARIKV